MVLTLYLIIFCFLYYVISFPLSFYAGFVVEHKFGFSNENLSAWLKDDIKKALLSLALFLVFMHVLYVFLRHFSATWWIWIALFWFAATIVLARITPTVILPLFFRYYPVEKKLKERVNALSRKCGIKVLDVGKIDFSKKTNKSNAAVIGLGRNKRVILADNLVRDFTDGEIDEVLAHEFGHHKLLHVWKLIAFSATSTLVSFYVLYVVSSKIAVLLGATGVSDVRIFPAFMLVLFLAGLIALPLQNGFSRKLEKEADAFALHATGNKAAFISLMKKLTEKNLADPNPPKAIKFLFYDHPPISERIRAAERFRAQ